MGAVYALAIGIVFRTPILSGFDPGFADRVGGLVASFWRPFFDPFVSDTRNAFAFKTIGFLD